MRHASKVIFPNRILVAVNSEIGIQYLAAEQLGKCPSCRDFVLMARRNFTERWVMLVSKKNENESHDLHRCPGEIRRNPILRELLGMGDNHAL